jgi:hypothetical protein
LCDGYFLRILILTIRCICKYAVCAIDYSTRETNKPPLGNKIVSHRQKIIETRSTRIRKTKPEIKGKRENKILLVQTADLSEERLEKAERSGRGITQAVSRRLPTTAARVWSCGIL